MGDVRYGDLAGADSLLAVEGPGRALLHFEGDVACAEEFDQLAVVEVGLHHCGSDLAELGGIFGHSDKDDLEKPVAHIDLVLAELDDAADRARVADRAEGEICDNALALGGGADGADRLDLEEVVDAAQDVGEVAEIVLCLLRGRV